MIIVKPAFDVTTPYRYLLYRYLIAGVIALPLLFYYWPKVKHVWKNLGVIIGLELLGTTVALSLLYLGLARTTAIEASLLVTSAPLFTTLVAVWLLKEKQLKNEWLGLVIALAGTVLLTLWPLFNSSASVASFSVSGNLLIIGNSITAALYFVWAKKYYRQLPKLFVTTISFFVGLVTFGLLSFFEQQFSIARLSQAIFTDLHSTPVLIAAGYMAIFGSIIGLTAYIKGQDGIEASEASLFTYLQPLIYLPLGVLLLHEALSPFQIVSLALILGGVAIAEKRFKPFKKK